MGDYKCTEDMFKVCENSNLCHLCDGERLYKEPKWMVRQKKEKERRKKKKYKTKKEGMSFEKKVSKRYNKKFTYDNKESNAYRRPGSGSIWSMPGDIVTENELIECKERGSTTSSGKKTISIPKEHLEKVRDEAFLEGKDVWYYIFGYKKSDDIYLVKDYNDELAMLQQIKVLKDRIRELEGELNEDS